jgi:hypothetical protein
MNAAKPAWRQVFDRVEEAVGRPLEEAVASSTYVDVVVVGLRAQRAVAGALARVVGGTVGGVLRAVNIPTRDDVLRLNRQLAVLAAEVRALGVAQQEARAPVRAPRPAVAELATRDGGQDG